MSKKESKYKNRSNIVGKVMAMAAVSILVVTAVFLVVYGKYKREYEDSLEDAKGGELIVALNEMYNLLDDEESIPVTDVDYLEEDVKNSREILREKLGALITELQDKETAVEKNNLDYIVIFYLISIGSIILIFGMIYFLVLRPFSKLEEFAGEIATGNLDKDLKYERVNMFGEFTWAFDHMRREIKKAKQCEQEAVENNKTVIATLSHDIKTPIASIRAYSEALSDNMDSTPERRNRYIDVITKKCDEVTKITNDMFIHSLHDLDKLVIKKEELEIGQVIRETVEAMEGSSTDIILGEVKECTLKGDAGRIAQVIENLINNARKYAPGDIHIRTAFVSDEGKEIDNSLVSEDNTNLGYMISVKDTGKGIPPEDIPFIFDKFYRGKNHGDEPGAGLGLFIVKYIMEQMDGRVELINEDDGLLVKLFFVVSL